MAMDTDSFKGPELQELYAKSMPTIIGPPYHSEFILEAQEPLLRVAFPETFVGRFPAEIREKIYIAVLRIEPTPDHLRYPYTPTPGRTYLDSLVWIEDHQVVSHKYKQRRWPNKDLNVCCPLFPPTPAAALVATFPPRACPRTGRTRLALLSTCRQVYSEAWRLYYSSNHFKSHSVSALIQFQDNIGEARRRELTSVEAMCDFGHHPNALKTLVGYLKECRNLRELTIVLDFDDAACLESLRELRGLKRVDVRCRCRPETQWWRYVNSRGSFSGSMEIGQKVRIVREIEECNALLLRPKLEVGEGKEVEMAR